jgi:hypothetical protein
LNHHQKRLTVLAADGIVAASGILHACGGFAQHGIARQLAAGAVD